MKTILAGLAVAALLIIVPPPTSPVVHACPGGQTPVNGQCVGPISQ